MTSNLISEYIAFCQKRITSDCSTQADEYELWDRELNMSVRKTISPFVWGTENKKKYATNEQFWHLKDLHDRIYNAWMTKYR